jgi:hypothetical protein
MTASFRALLGALQSGPNARRTSGQLPATFVDPGFSVGGHRIPSGNEWREPSGTRSSGVFSRTRASVVA